MITYKRIAKNTLSLYLRQLISIFVSFYATRLILQILGVADFGLYNVIGGIVPLLTFFISAMTSATQRFIAVDLGKGNVKHLRTTFSTIVYIYWILSLVIFIIAETVGVWYLNCIMVIQADRMFVANIVYQLSIFSSILGVISTPYSATIVAHERLDVYAYVGIFEVVLRLVLVLFLYYVPVIDNLLIYAAGIFCISLISRLIYQLFCRKHFHECKLERNIDWNLSKNMLTYTSFNMIGTLAIIGKNQGANLLINLFFGTVINAAQGIAMQVINTINSFVSNFYMSARPQIIKSYSAGLWNETWRLLCLSTKYSFFLLLLISIPVLVAIDEILTFWLGKYPEVTSTFIKLIMLEILAQSLTSQLIVLLQAENKIKSYQLTYSALMLLAIPISYLFYDLGFPPYYIYVVSLLLSVVSIAIMLLLTKLEISNFSIYSYVKDIFSPILKVVVMFITIGIVPFMTVENVWLKCIMLFFVFLLSVFFVGMSKSERKRIMQIMNMR